MATPSASPFTRPAPHRATRRYRITIEEVVANILTAAFVLLAVYCAWPLVLDFWYRAFEFWLSRIPMEGWQVSLHDVKMPWKGASIQIAVQDTLPGTWQWWTVLAITAGIYGLSYLISRERLPLVYLLRTLAFIQLTALLYFYFWPERLPVTLSKFASDMIQMVGCVLFIVPILHACTFYIFRMSIWRKLLTTAVTLLYLALCLPPHLSLLLLIMQKGSALLLPINYFVFMLLPYIMVVIAIYGYSLSKTKADIQAITS